MSLLISFGDNVVRNNDSVPYSYTLSPFSIKWKRRKNTLYTVLLYDVSEDDYLLYRVNIGRKGTGTDMIEPSKIVNPGKYEVSLFEQTEVMDKDVPQDSYTVKILEKIRFRVLKKLAK